MKTKSPSFRSTIFLAFLLLSLLPLAGMSVILYGYSKNTLALRMRDTVNDNLSIAAGQIDSSITNFRNIAVYLSKDSNVISALEKRNYADYGEYFSDLQKIYSLIGSTIATLNDDIPVYIAGTRNSMARYTNMEYFAGIYGNFENEFYRDIADKFSGKDDVLFWVHRRIDGAQRKEVVLSLIKQIPSPDRASDEILGYLILDIYDDFFQSSFANIRAYDQNNVYLLDRDGTIITDKVNKNRTGFYIGSELFRMLGNSQSAEFTAEVDGVSSQCFSDTAQKTGFQILEVVPRQVVLQDRKVIGTVFLFLSALTIFAVAVSSYFLSRSISQPVTRLSELMLEVKRGNRKVKFDLAARGELQVLADSFNEMVQEIDTLIESVYEKQLLLKDAQLDILRAQINPHFLYNTLESVKWMAKLGRDSDVVRMVTALGKFLRYSISNHGETVRLQECMKQVENYLIIEKIRYGDKFSYHIEYDPSLADFQILKLLVQPLVENAIIHGIEPKAQGGSIFISVFVREENLVLEVRDDGVGFAGEPAMGLALNNLASRARLFYNSSALTLQRAEGLTVARLTLPLKSEGGAAADDLCAEE